VQLAHNRKLELFPVEFPIHMDELTDTKAEAQVTLKRYQALVDKMFATDAKARL